MPAATPDGTTIQKIQSSLRFNYAQLDRRPRAPRKDIDPKERARLQNRIAQLRADLDHAKAVAPTPKPDVRAGRPRKAIQPAPGELFPAFAQAEADEHERRRAADRERRIHEHREHLALVWPEWAGPVAGGPGTSAFCEVDTPDTFSLTHGERRYHYMAPCRVESVSADGLTIIAVVEYTNPGWCRDRYNGERLRLDFTEAGPPRAMLRAERDEQPHAATAAPSQDLPAAHPWDTGGRGPVGSTKAGKAVLRCPHCKVTFYERPKCPSCSKPIPAHP